VLTTTESTFVIEASRERVWECLTKALFRSIPLEQMNFLNERSLIAVLRVRMSRFELPLRVNIEISEISEPEILAATIKATGVKGIIGFNQTVRFTLADTNEGGTKVSARLEAEQMSLPVKTFLLWKVKGFANDSLSSVERLLREWTEHK